MFQNNLTILWLNSLDMMTPPLPHWKMSKLNFEWKVCDFSDPPPTFGQCPKIGSFFFKAFLQFFVSFYQIQIYQANISIIYKKEPYRLLPVLTIWLKNFFCLDGKLITHIHIWILISIIVYMKFPLAL